MSMTQIVPMLLGVSIMIIVFALGLTTRPRDLLVLVRQPSLLLRSLLAMSLIMPLVAVLAVKLFRLETPVAAALIALSLAPVPPLLPGKQTKAGGDSGYAVNLLVVAALFAIIWIPIALELIQLIFGVPLAARPADIVGVVGKTVLLPLLAGAIVGMFIQADLARRLSGLLSSVGTLALLVGVVVILAGAWKAIVAQVGDGAVIAMVVVVVCGLVIGHLLGGPNKDDRTVLALACASRHPGMAIALAQLEFPNLKGPAAAVLLYLLVAALVSIPYVAWRKRLSGLGKRG